MNQISLDGIIWGIQDAYQIGDVQYQKANLTVKNANGTDSIIALQFKKFQCDYRNNQRAALSGNVRSHSIDIGNGKHKVNIYVYTYFDPPICSDNYNNFIISGRICKMDEMRVLQSGKNNIHFILANNILKGESKLNSYLPCIAWGEVASEIEKIGKNKEIVIGGELHSREYKKPLENGQFELRIAHELMVVNVTEAR